MTAPQVILTDIEGTTSSIDFVKDVLFPHAAAALPGFLRQHWDTQAVRDAVMALRTSTGLSLDTSEQVNALLQDWIREDRKDTPLKALQGLIWREGYEQGRYRAHLYPEVADCLRRWRQQGIDLYVYSSGSVAAQKLFFGHSEAGDLTPLFSGYFDTRIGHKREADSYRRIVSAIGVPAGDILFLSDIEEELDAAATAGMRTCQLDRQEAGLQGRHPVVTRFDQLPL